jgi:hypothetical protein
MSSTVALSGFVVLSFSLTAGLFGVPTLQAELDTGDSPAPTGEAVLSFATPDPAHPNGEPLEVTWKFTIIDSAATLGRCTVFAVAGAGALREHVDGIDYATIHVRHAVEDIVRDALRGGVGEVADPAALAALDALPPLQRWTRPAGSGLAALGLLCRRAGIDYRIGPTGLLWVGAETWPRYTGHTTGQPYFTREPSAHGTTEVALDAPDLLPGQTMLPPENIPGSPLRVSGVLYELAAGGAFRAHVTIASASDPAGAVSEGRTRDLWRRAMTSLQPNPLFRMIWAATVVDQDPSTFAVGLRLDPTDGPPVLTLSSVPVWPGLPGACPTVPLGAQCIVEFLGGREDKPVVRSFAAGTAMTQIQFLDSGGSPGTRKIVRDSDSVTCIDLLYAGPGTLTAVPAGTGTVQITGTVSGTSILKG